MKRSLTMLDLDRNEWGSRLLAERAVQSRLSLRAASALVIELAQSQSGQAVVACSQRLIAPA